MGIKVIKAHIAATVEFDFMNDLHKKMIEEKISLTSFGPIKKNFSSKYCMLLQEPRIKIHGCMKSGTNLLEFHLRNYFRCEPLVNEHAWKHGPINKELSASHVIIYKDVFAWLHSMFGYLQWYRSNKNLSYCMNSPASDFKQFIRSSYKYKIDNHVMNYENPVLIYKNSHDSWLDSECRGAKIFVRYEDVLLKTTESLDEVCRSMSQKCGGRNIVYPRGGQSYEGFKHRSTSSDPDYEKMEFYRNREYMKQFDEEDVAHIQATVGQDLPSRLDSTSIKVG